MAQPSINPDSPSALVRGAKIAVFGSGKMMVSCQVGESVMHLFCDTKSQV